MKKILAFGASNNRKSINKRFAGYTALQVKGAQVNLVDLNEYEMPIFSVDRQAQDGIHEKAHLFKKQIEETDGIVFSLAEHNGSYSAAFKNIVDWTSRIEGKLWSNKPVFLLSTSPGGRGGKTVFDLAKTYLPHMGAQLVASFSLPQFNQNFSEENGVTHMELKGEYLNQIELFEKAL